MRGPLRKQMSSQKWAKHVLRVAVGQIADGLDHLVEQGLVVHEHVAGAFQAQDVADVPVEAAAVQAVRMVALAGPQELQPALLPGHHAVPDAHAGGGDALLAPLVAPRVMLLPRGPVLQQVVYLGRDARGVRLLPDDGAVHVTHVPGAIGEGAHDLGLEVGPVLGVRAQSAIPVEVEPEPAGDHGVGGVAVRPGARLLARYVPFLGPLLKRLGPVAEVNQGQPVVRLVVEHRRCPLAVGHRASLVLTRCRCQALPPVHGPQRDPPRPLRRVRPLSQDRGRNAMYRGGRARSSLAGNGLT